MELEDDRHFAASMRDEMTTTAAVAIIDVCWKSAKRASDGAGRIHHVWCMHLQQKAKSQPGRERDRVHPAELLRAFCRGLRARPASLVLGCARADNFIAESLISWNYPTPASERV